MHVYVCVLYYYLLMIHTDVSCDWSRIHWGRVWAGRLDHGVVERDVLLVEAAQPVLVSGQLLHGRGHVGRRLQQAEAELAHLVSAEGNHNSKIQTHTQTHTESVQLCRKITENLNIIQIMH